MAVSNTSSPLPGVPSGSLSTTRAFPELVDVEAGVTRKRALSSPAEDGHAENATASPATKHL